MPPLAGVAIFALAAETTLTAEIAAGITGALAGGILDSVAIIGGDIAAGAIIGAGAGAASTAAAGGDPADGALFGAISGGVGQGVTGAISGDAALVDTGLTSTQAQAIGQAAGSTASGVAQGKDIGTALERGAASGGLSYLAGSVLNPSSPTAPAPGGDQVASTQPANVTDAGVEQAVQTATKDIGPTPIGVVADSTQTPSQDKKGVEGVVVSATKTPSIFDGFSSAFNDVLSAVQDQPQPIKSAEKALLSQQIMDLIFPRSSGQYSTSGIGTGTGGAGGGTGTGTSPSAGAGSTGPSVAAQAAQAAQVGQTGGTSIYGPGGPIFGEPAGATKYSPWNVASLRTDQGNA